jgi:hypothetical protein
MAHLRGTEEVELVVEDVDVVVEELVVVVTVVTVVVDWRTKDEARTNG